MKRKKTRIKLAVNAGFQKPNTLSSESLLNKRQKELFMAFVHHIDNVYLDGFLYQLYLKNKGGK